MQLVPHLLTALIPVSVVKVSCRTTPGRERYSSPSKAVKPRTKAQLIQVAPVWGHSLTARITLEPILPVNRLKECTPPNVVSMAHMQVTKAACSDKDINIRPTQLA